MKNILMIGVFFIFNTFILEAANPPPIEEITQKCLKTCSQIDDYTCFFSRKERMNNKVREQRRIIFKFKKPLSVYMKWTEGNEKGAEAIYLQGKYNNKVPVHAGGFWSFISVKLDPEGTWMKKYNRHSIREVGIEYIARKIVEDLNRSRKNNEGQIGFEKEEKLNERPTLVYTGLFPPNKGYYCKKAIINFDAETCLPIKIGIYGWEDELLEEYLYEDLKFNVGLTDKAFDINNPGYGF